MSRPVTRPTKQDGPAPEERELIARFVGGERDVFRVLIRSHIEALRALARRAVGDVHAADDVVQEALIRAARGLAEFRGDSSVRTWLFTICVRVASEPRRWRGDRRGESLRQDVPDTLGPTPEAAALARELRDRLEEAMERLPMRQRTALHLRAAEGLGYEHIAAVLECSAAAARMLVLEARRKVLARMGRYLEP